MSTEGRLIAEGHGWSVRVRDNTHNWHEFLVTGSPDPAAAELAAKAKWPGLYVVKVETLGYGQVRKVEVDQWFPANAPEIAQ